MGADTLVVKKKRERNLTTQEKKRKPDYTKTWKKGKTKCIGHQQAVCLANKDRCKIEVR